MKKFISGEIESAVEQLLCRVVLDSVDGRIEILGREFLTESSWRIVADGWSMSGYRRMDRGVTGDIVDRGLEFCFDGDWDIYLSDLLLFKLVYSDVVRHSRYNSPMRYVEFPFILFENGQIVLD